VRLHDGLGSADRLSLVPPNGTHFPIVEYEAYRATAAFISSDGHIVQYYTTLKAGAPNSDQAMHAIPSLRASVASIGQRLGAVQTGVLGDAAGNYDESNTSNHDLRIIIPAVLAVIALILGVQLRSVVAPCYLIASVALSYFAAFGLAVLVFIIGFGHSGVNYILPFLLFVFLMAIGEDYNILLMGRIREEARQGSLDQAVSRALVGTGTTITSAGLVLAGTFTALSVASGTIRDIGIALAAGIVLDTFIVRTLLVPSTVLLLGRWNWWPAGPPG
jgi:RND superfamily putative drug exporter